MMPLRVLDSEPKRGWSNGSFNLICGGPVLPVQNKTIAGFLTSWLRGNNQSITFTVVQFITFMVKFYYICGSNLPHLWSIFITDGIAFMFFLPAFMADTAKNCSRLCILPRTLNCYHQQSLSMLKIKSLSSSQIRFHVCGVLVVIVVKRPSTTIFLYIRSRSEKLNLVVVLRTVSSKTFFIVINCKLWPRHPW